MALCQLPAAAVLPSNTKWQPLPGFGAAPGSARAAAASSEWALVSSGGGGFSIPVEGFSILGVGLQHPLAPRTPNLAETCLVPTTLRVLPGDIPTPAALGARLSPALGQIGSVPPARREIRHGVGSCWYHMLN